MPAMVGAQVPNTETGGETTDYAINAESLLGLDIIGQNLDLSDEDPRVIAARLINIALGFLGIAFLVMVLYSGALVLFSFGKQERLDKAKRSFLGALIGLFLILASNSIVLFLLQSFSEATGGGSIPHF